jgi:hypothetical protein
MPNKPEFAAITPFKVPADAVDDYAKKRNIPTQVFPHTAEIAKTGLPPPTAEIVKLSLDVPKYVMKTLRQRGLDEDRSVRAVVLRALKQSGIDIAEEDLFDDGRRRSETKKGAEAPL